MIAIWLEMQYVIFSNVILVIKLAYWSDKIFVFISISHYFHNGDQNYALGGDGCINCKSSLILNLKFQDSRSPSHFWDGFASLTFLTSILANTISSLAIIYSMLCWVSFVLTMQFRDIHGRFQNLYRSATFKINLSWKCGRIKSDSRGNVIKR